MQHTSRIHVENMYSLYFDDCYPAVLLLSFDTKKGSV